jgi:signal transduction histidine kinase
MTSLIDINKHKQAEKKLSESEEYLRLLSRKVIDSQENERKRVARDLHDSVSGNLAAIKLALEEKLESMKTGTRNDFYSLENIIANIKDTILEVRRISNHLMPSVLEDLGLVEAIRWFCREQGKYYQNVRITHRIEIEEDRLLERIKIAIFRVIQESMSNALRHGQADAIELILTNAGHRVELCVKDNGCGFDPEGISSNPDSLNGLGLKGMKERAEVCNGIFEIFSEIGKGTQVNLSLPYGAMK